MLALVSVDQDDPAKPDQTLRSEIFRQLPRERIEHAVATIGELARPPENQQALEIVDGQGAKPGQTAADPSCRSRSCGAVREGAR